MVSIPDEIMKLINDPKSVRVVATKSAEGHVHAIQVGSLKAAGPDMLIMGAILMNRTAKNLEAMKAGKENMAILVSSELKSFEIKARPKDFVTSGPIFDKMNEELKKMGMAARGVWLLEPVEVWNQSASYEAGKKIV